MRPGFYIFVPLLLLVACGREAVPDADGLLSRAPEGEVYHGMIELGDKLEDPYAVENMRIALNKVYPAKSGRIDIVPTDLYVRFLPSGDAQLKQLQELDVYLMDHPMDYQILREGDYYQDPELSRDAITWQYAVVPRDFEFPEGIQYELLDECYLAEHDPDTRAAVPDIDWAAVEAEAFRLTGNADLLEPVTKSGMAPSGRITIEDPGFSGGKPFGVAGVKVVCNVFVKIGSAYTTRDGYYQIEKTFTGKPRYRLVFQNQKDFSIGLNLVIIPASVSTLGKGGPAGIDFHVTAGSDGALFRRCAVNNAAYDYLSRCTATDLDIALPPGDLRFWIFPDLTSSSACMLHHGAFLDNELLQRYLGQWMALIKIFLPDITIGASGQEDYASIYKAVVHEMAHASHFAQAGTAFWSPYIAYVLECYVTQGRNGYGDGSVAGAGYCEVGEMWGYFMQESLYKDRYGGVMGYWGNQFWFKPDIFTYLYERGLSRADLFRALRPEVASVDDLKDELISRYPDRETVIHQSFQRYGK